MRFSIITITFNAEKYLSETLASVASQDFTDYEHILWDGGSTDQTLEIAARFPHVRVIRGKDEGISDAMNLGAKEARGEFLLHLHADDRLSSQSSLMVIDTALKAYPKTKWLYGQAETIDHAGKVIETPRYVPFSRKKLKRYNIISHPATFVERELFLKSGGFSKDFSYCMDYDLWLRLSKTTSPLALPRVISCFRVHEGSTSTREKIKVADEAYRVRNRYIQNPWERWRSYRTWKRRKDFILS